MKRIHFVLYQTMCTHTPRRAKQCITSFYRWHSRDKDIVQLKEKHFILLLFQEINSPLHLFFMILLKTKFHLSCLFVCTVRR